MPAPSSLAAQTPARVPAQASFSPLGRPSNRPAEYPFEVIWCLDDCKKDPEVILSKGNESRPPMEMVIRNTDGSWISEGTYLSIKRSAQPIAWGLLKLTPPLSASSLQPKTKSYFASFHPQEWNDAIAQLEAKELLLTLCAGNWKAAHLLNQCLTATEYSKRRSNSSKPRGSKCNQPSSKSSSMNPPAPKKSRRNDTDSEDGTDHPISIPTPVPKTKVALTSESFGSRALKPPADADINPSCENLISMSHPLVFYTFS